MLLFLYLITYLDKTNIGTDSPFRVQQSSKTDPKYYRKCQD